MRECRPERDINRLDGFRDFIQSWEDATHPKNRESVALFHTGYGNINSTGVLGDYRGYALSRWHSQFNASLEDGIKQLVLLLTLQFGWVTYSSCEGHQYRGRGLRSVERRVGIVPRSDAEESAIRHTLGTVAAETNHRYRGSAVFVEVCSRALEADGRAYPVIDFVFHRRRTWKQYFSEIDGVYGHVLALLVIRRGDSAEDTRAAGAPEGHSPAPGEPAGAATPRTPTDGTPSA